MSVSGVRCDQSVISKFNELKMSGGKGKESLDFIVAKVEDKTGMIILDEAPEYGTTAAAQGGVEKIKGVPTSYKRLEELCITNGCRYAFYVFKWRQLDGERDAVVFIIYCDDNAKTKQKLTYSTSKDAIKRACSGFGKTIEANDKDEIDYFTILAEISGNKYIKEDS